MTSRRKGTKQPRKSKSDPGQEHPIGRLEFLLDPPNGPVDRGVLERPVEIRAQLVQNLAAHLGVGAEDMLELAHQSFQAEWARVRRTSGEHRDRVLRVLRIFQIINVGRLRRHETWAQDVGDPLLRELVAGRVDPKWAARLEREALSILRTQTDDVVEENRCGAAFTLREWFLSRVKDSPEPESAAPQLARDLVKQFENSASLDTIEADLPRDYASSAKIEAARKAIKRVLGNADRAIDEHTCETAIAAALRGLGYPTAKAKSLYRSSVGVERPG